MIKLFGEIFDKYLLSIGFEYGSGCMYFKQPDYWMRLNKSVNSKVMEVQVLESAKGKVKSSWFDDETKFLEYFEEQMAVYIVMTR